MESLPLSKVTCIFGKRGSGKSTLARSLSLAEDRVLVIDSMAEYGESLSWDDFCFSLIEHIDGSFYLVFFPPAPKEADQVFALATVAEHVTVVVEEVDMYCNPTSEPPCFSDCIRRGRHRGVSLITTSRRPAEVSRLLTSQADEFYIFRFSEPRDLQYFAQTFGPEIVDEIRTLGEHEYIYRKV